jgi:epoxyqueuosine reductase
MVCPWNRYAEHNQEDDFKPRNGLASAELMELLKWTEEEFLQRTEGSAIRRTGYTGWLRNLAVGIGNSTVQENTHQVLMSAKGQSDLVDEHIDWALRQLESR